jgi:hypothetical protein
MSLSLEVCTEFSTCLINSCYKLYFQLHKFHLIVSSLKFIFIFIPKSNYLKRIPTLYYGLFFFKVDFSLLNLMTKSYEKFRLKSKNTEVLDRVIFLDITCLHQLMINFEFWKFQIYWLSKRFGYQ